MSSAQSIPTGGRHGAGQVPHMVPSLPDDLAALESALIQNKVAPKLNPVEEARACATLIKELGLTQRQIGERMGLAQSTVSQMMRLLNLSEEILGFLERRQLDASHARVLLRVKDLEVRGQLARAVVAEGWSTAVFGAHVREREYGLEQGLDDATVLSVAKAWGDVLSVEADARPEPHGRVSVKLIFASAEAALASAGQLSGELVHGKGVRSGSDCKIYVPREIIQRAGTSASVGQLGGELVHGKGVRSGSDCKIYVPGEIIQLARTLAWATALGAITAEALAERDELSTAMAQECLDEAVSLGFMERHSVLVGYPALYKVTFVGRRLAAKHADAGGYTYPAKLARSRVSIREARHTIACASVVAALERRYPGGRVIGERELHREESGQGRRLGSVDIQRHGETRSHYPDIVVWPPSVPGESPPLPIAVEVELTPKEKKVRTAICRAWADARHIEMVLYYVEKPVIEKRLLDTIGELKAEKMIVVKPLSEILTSLPGFDLSREAETDH
jgi:transcriptional regulator with XRE-family HTH domain